MKHGSLFSGIGGFDLAAEWMGWENVFHCELDDKARGVIEKKFPNARSIHNVNDIYRYAHEMIDFYGDGETAWCERHDTYFSDCACIDCSEWDDEMPAIDILTAGFPCQPFSENGKKKGKHDERNLWPETNRIISRINPSWFVGENVPGLATWDNGSYISQIKSDIEGQGFKVWFINIPATSVDAEHQRERIWIVANNKSVGIQRLRAKGEQQPQSLDQKVLPLRNSNGKWEVEPDIRRADDGIPRKMDRLKLIGNAIVPQVAYQIFKAIEEYELTK